MGKKTKSKRATQVIFKADPDTMEDIDRLAAEVAIGSDVGAIATGYKSQAIRKAIKEAASRLRDKVGEGRDK